MRVKLHTLLDLQGNLPAFIDVKPGKIHEIHVLDELLPEPGSIYIMDRAYLDFERLYPLHQALTSFIIRSRKDFRFHRLAAHPVDKLTGLRCDQTTRLKSFYPAKLYPDLLCRIRYRDAESENHLIFLANNFLLPTLAIPQLYQCRWAGRVVLQMGQTTPAPQEVLRTFTQCGENSDLDRHLRLRALGDRSQTPAARTQSLPHVANFERHLARKIAHLQAFLQIDRSTELASSRNQLALFNL